MTVIILQCKVMLIAQNVTNKLFIVTINYNKLVYKAAETFFSTYFVIESIFLQRIIIFDYNQIQTQLY